MVDSKLKSRVARYKNNWHHIILTIELECMYILFCLLKQMLNVCHICDGC